MSPLPTKEQIREYLISNIIDKMVQHLIDEESLSLEQAMDIVYRSHTIQLLQMPEGELYVQSPAYVCDMMTQERHDIESAIDYQLKKTKSTTTL